MLINLYIENYVLFDKQNLNFKDGFISLTGDTGAGKSLIIDALAYLCGERLKSNISKDTSKNTYLEGTFTFSNQKTLGILADHGIEVEDVVIVSRDITPQGKSISRINGRSVTLSLLKEVFDGELDIHSQRDTQYLLNKNMHMKLLDSYSNHEDLLTLTNDSYKKFNSLKKEIELLENSVFNEDEIAFIKTQIKEIEKVNPSEEEYNDLLLRVSEINAYDNIYKALSKPKEYFSKRDGIMDLLYESKISMEDLENYEDYTELIERVTTLYLEVEDINSELNNAVSSLSFDEYELNNLEERLFEINQIVKRFGGSFLIFNERYDEMLKKVEAFESKDIVLYELNKELKEAKAIYLEYAEKLSKSRHKQIVNLERDIMSHLVDLQLENARFKISIVEKPFSKDGYDDVEFLVSMNKGFKLEPLIKVASGGELSRLMLGLKVVFSKLFGVSTVIFDEIDTGVSGSVALSIGYKMHELSLSTQVFSVTHLAQVAACSDSHYYVEKDNSQDIGHTSIEELKGDAFIEKLALMSTGIISEASLKSSRELYQNAQKKISDHIG